MNLAETLRFQAEIAACDYGKAKMQAKMSALKKRKIKADNISDPSHFGPNTDMGPSRSLDPA